MIQAHAMMRVEADTGESTAERSVLKTAAGRCALLTRALVKKGVVTAIGGNTVRIRALATVMARYVQSIRVSAVKNVGTVTGETIARIYVLNIVVYRIA